MAALAFGVLMVVAGVVGGSITIMHRAMLFREKHGGFKLRSRTKQTKKHDKTRVVIAAAVAAYLKAEEESKKR
jgi:hypothetical protein